MLDQLAGPEPIPMGFDPQRLCLPLGKLDCQNGSWNIPFYHRAVSFDA